jgi:hypothetical protein
MEEEVMLYGLSMSPENIEIEGKDKVIFGYLSGIIILGAVGVSFYLYSCCLINLSNLLFDQFIGNFIMMGMSSSVYVGSEMSRIM